MEENLHLVDEVELTTEDRDPYRFVTTKGVVLKLKKVNRLLVAEGAKKFPVPKVPTWMNPEKGREEENPNDPDYLTAIRDSKVSQAMLIYNIYMGFGTEIVSIPDDVESVDGINWVEMLEEIAGIDVPTRPRARYVAWLKYYILDDDELNSLLDKIMRLSGAIKEEDIKKIMDSFRGDESGDTA